MNVVRAMNSMAKTVLKLMNARKIFMIVMKMRNVSIKTVLTRVNAKNHL